MAVQTSSNAVSAAVVREKGGPFIIEKLRLGEPRDDEVLVRIVATGMCHTDMVVRDQIYPVPQPIVLGHEGAGVVEQVGSRVAKVQPGDHVVLSFMSCGHCRLCAQGRPANCVNFNAHNFSGAAVFLCSAITSAHSTPPSTRFPPNYTPQSRVLDLANYCAGP